MKQRGESERLAVDRNFKFGGERIRKSENNNNKKTDNKNNYRL